MPAFAEIPYGAYWSTPFAKWQGSLQHLHSVRFAAWQTRRFLERLDIDKSLLDYGVLGITVPQQHAFYGAPWMFGMAGVGHLAGPTISQACATSARAIVAAAMEIANGGARAALAVTADRCSNGPHVYYPHPDGPGGTGAHENWVLDNFSCDPLGPHSMLQTAENVAARYGIDSAEQHDVVMRRVEQYADALADDRAFQRRYMELPLEVPDNRFRKTIASLEGDEGIHVTTIEGLAKLEPVIEGGTVTFGGQTHPADGNCGMIITDPGATEAFTRDASITVGLVGFGQARTELAYMPEATIPAARAALASAGLEISDMAAIKSHNPFALNDIIFARDTGCDISRMNNFGCSLIWGHPQAPTGMRAVIELIEELVVAGGGYGLFHGCAAGDTAMALVLRVSD